MLQKLRNGAPVTRKKTRFSRCAGWYASSIEVLGSRISEFLKRNDIAIIRVITLFGLAASLIASFVKAIQELVP